MTPPPQINALLVGSRESWRRKLIPKLEQHGIILRWIWEGKGDVRPTLPQGCGLCIITTDCNSHAISAPAAARARGAGIPVVHMPHRWAEAHTRLVAAGFAELTPEPEQLTPEAFPMPSSQTPYLLVIARNPRQLTDALLVTVPRDNTQKDAKTRIMQARCQLGIALHGRYPRLYLPLYLSECARLGVTPNCDNIPTVSDKEWAAHLQLLADYPSRRKVRVVAPPELVIVPAPAPVLAPVPVPAPWGLDDLKVAVGMVREIMLKHGYTTITVPSEGLATFRRRVVLEQEGAFTPE